MSENDLALFLNTRIGYSKYFFWREALELHQWGIHAFPESDDVVFEIRALALKMDKVRDIINKPLVVTSWYRPPAYNVFIKGALNSKHIYGMGCDVIVHGMTGDQIRAKMLPYLAEVNLRMEKIEGASWAHFDSSCTENLPIAQRYFKP